MVFRIFQRASGFADIVFSLLHNPLTASSALIREEQSKRRKMTDGDTWFALYGFRRLGSPIRSSLSLSMVSQTSRLLGGSLPATSAKKKELGLVSSATKPTATPLFMSAVRRRPASL